MPKSLQGSNLSAAERMLVFTVLVIDTLHA